MTLYERYDALMREEWQKSTDGLQNERALARLVEEEREACAKVAENYTDDDIQTAEFIAKLIRARKDTP